MAILAQQGYALRHVYMYPALAGCASDSLVLDSSRGQVVTAKNRHRYGFPSVQRAITVGVMRKLLLALLLPAYADLRMTMAEATSRLKRFYRIRSKSGGILQFLGYTAGSHLPG
jgi:hypothetical protein